MPWLPMIGYHNTGGGEAQPLPLDMWCCRPPFIHNYIHHISRLADKLTPAWNGAKTEPRRVARQVLEQPPQPSRIRSHPHAPLLRLLASSCRSEAECIHFLTWQRSSAQTGEWRHCVSPAVYSIETAASHHVAQYSQYVASAWRETQLLTNENSLYLLFYCYWCFAAVFNPSAFDMRLEIKTFKSSWINDFIIIKQKKNLK